MSRSFEDLLSEWERDPAFVRAMEESRARYARAVTVPCAWGNCTHRVDTLDNKILDGMGPIMCPCDHLPGWRSSYVAGQPKPAAPVKARGRHGSRVQRSRRRHRLPDLSAFGEWLPAYLGRDR